MPEKNNHQPKEHKKCQKFEKIIRKRSKDFFNKHKILCQNQVGFRDSYSTSLATADMYKNLL